MLGVGLAVWVSLDVRWSSLEEPNISMRTYGAEIALVSVGPLVGTLISAFLVLEVKIRLVGLMNVVVL